VHHHIRLLHGLEGSLPGASRPEDIRFEAEDNRRMYDALRRFPSLEPGRTMKGEDASSVVWSVLMAAQRAIGERINAENLHLPGVPGDAWIGELPAMKVGDVRGCVENIAQAADEAPEDLLEAATETARLISIYSEIKSEHVELAIGVKLRERILADDKTLEKIARYEAHLSRQLYQALHELENLQMHRTTGKGASLARLDLQASLLAES
jgi:hypothetical protein